MNALRNESQATARVRDARAELLQTHPFYGVLSLKLELIESTGIESMAVTHKALKFNPQWVLSLSHAELKGVVAHEVLHLALGHHARQGARDPERWNDACDYVVNPLCLADGFTLPKGLLLDKQHEGKTAETVYNALGDKKPDPNATTKQPGNGSAPNGPPAQGQPGKGKQPGQGAGATGSFEPAGPADSDANGESEREWRQNVNEAIRAASSAGKLPGHLRKQMEVTTKPQADYKTLLRRFFTDQSRTRSTWSKRNKRFADVFLPGRVNDGLGDVVIFVDCSGSVVPVIPRFGAEVNGILEDCEPARVHIVYFDSRVRHVDSFEQGEPVKIVAHGGGGTLFQPAFDYVESAGWNPVCAVFLTDTFCSDKPRDPGYPVLWATYGARGAQGPFGETVAID
jgi:predicted metal-dependent peptidase